MRLSFTIGDPVGTDTTIEVQASNDLGVTDPWTAIASKVGQGAWTGPGAVNVSDVIDCRREVTVDDTVTVGAAPKRFLRLRAVLP